MKTFEALETLWREASPPSRGRGELRLITRRTAPGVHETSERAEVTPEEGLVGDRWSRVKDPHANYQITLMEARVAAWLAGDRIALHSAGDNLLVDLDLAEEALPIGARLRIGEVVLEVTAPLHLGCKKFGERFGEDALRWVNWKEHRARRLRGLNCRVVTGGTVAVGDVIEVL